MGQGTLGRGGQGVSFAPGGRGAPAAGYNKMASGPKAGSMESLDSTQSLTLSTYSYGSSTSTGTIYHKRKYLNLKFFYFRKMVLGINSTM